MKALFDLDFLRLFLLFILPGLISMQVYRQVMPASKIKWGTALFEALFYSSLNYAILSPLVWRIHYAGFADRHPTLYGFWGIIILLVGPVVWPLIYTWLIRNTEFVRKLQLPFPSAWDYYFDQRNPAFVLIHLKSGKLVGGYYGSSSYATSFPNNGDIYLETVYKVDGEGHFGEPISDSDGIIVQKGEYHYMEFFEVPIQQDQKVKDNGEG